MKYHLLEHESYRELLKAREEVKNSYLKQEKALNDRKEKLFRNKDYSKWGYTGDGGIAEIEKYQDKLATSKQAAFTYMLQKETKELEFAKEELAFYSNQCLDETRRVGKDNGKLLIEHFIQMSQTQCSYINQVSSTFPSDFHRHSTDCFVPSIPTAFSNNCFLFCRLIKHGQTFSPISSRMRMVHPLMKLMWDLVKPLQIFPML